MIANGAALVKFVGCERAPSGELLVLVDEDGVSRRVGFAELCRDLPWTTHVGATEDADQPTDPEWAALPTDVRCTALTEARHLRQMLTGSRFGNVARDEQLGRLDPRYDPRLVPVLKDRIEAKSTELAAAGAAGVTVPSLYRKLAILQKRGVMGLVDKRWLRRVDLLDTTDPEVLATVADVVAARITHSKLSQRQWVAVSRAALAQKDLIVTNHRLQLIVGELTRGQAAHRLARSRQTHANRPPDPGRHITATRPGEVVEIDATPSNVHTWYPDLGWGPATIVTCIDVYSRQILALRVVPGAATTRDAALLLWDTCRSEVTRGGWPWKLRRWHGMPTFVTLETDEPGDAAGEAPVSAERAIGVRTNLIPSAVVIDHGAEFDAEHFQSVCMRNGIDAVFAKPRTPTDKPHVEAWHRTLDEALRTLPGYKGPNPQDHPAGAEADAALTVADLQDMLWTWIVTIYHVRPHEGLRDSANPAITASPNMMFDRFLAVGGRIEVPHDPYRVIDFLSTVSRLVQPDGVHLLSRTFNSDELRALRPRMQSGVGSKPRELNLYYDRWDLTRVYFKHPFEHSWVGVPSVDPASGAVAPFSEALTRHAIRRNLDGEKPVSGEDLRALEQKLLANWNAGVFHDRRDRRVHALEEARQTGYARDIADWSEEMRELAFPPRPVEPEGLVGFEDADLDDAEVFDYADDDVDGLAL